MATYRIDGQAQREIDQIWDYYYGVANHRVANRRIGRLYESFRLLSKNPYMGVARRRFRPDARSHAVPGTPYIILYYTIHDLTGLRLRESLMADKNSHVRSDEIDKHTKGNP